MGVCEVYRGPCVLVLLRPCVGWLWAWVQDAPFSTPCKLHPSEVVCPNGRHQEAVGTPRRVGEVPGGGRSAPGKWPSHPCVSNGLSEEEPAPAEAQERWDEEAEKDL